MEDEDVSRKPFFGIAKQQNHQQYHHGHPSRQSIQNSQRKRQKRVNEDGRVRSKVSHKNSTRSKRTGAYVGAIRHSILAGPLEEDFISPKPFIGIVKRQDHLQHHHGHPSRQSIQNSNSKVVNERAKVESPWSCGLLRSKLSISMEKQITRK